MAQERAYHVNAKVRPLLFWMGRDNVGGARITWREGLDGRRALELLIGTDPSRAPRQINRWGYIVEELHGENAEVLGVMKESKEETMEEAEAQIARDAGVSTFKAARTTITGARAVGGVMTVHAPAHLTYQQLDALLSLIPAEAPSARTLELPTGTQNGFLVAMEAILRDSIDPCRTANNATPRDLRMVSYVYNQTVYDLSLLSCNVEAQTRTKSGTFADVVDGRFQVRNRTTKSETKFRVLYGASGDLRAVPVRAVFRPRWWLEVEMVLDWPSRGPLTAVAGRPQGRRHEDAMGTGAR